MQLFPTDPSSYPYSPSKRCLLCLFREPKPRSIFLSSEKQTLNVDSYCFISFAFTYYLLHLMWIPGSNAPAVTLTLKCLYSFFLLHWSNPYLIQKQEVLFTSHKGHEINTDASKFVGWSCCDHVSNCLISFALED